MNDFWVHGWMDGWVDEWADGCIDGWVMNGWVGGQMVKKSNSSSV